MNNPLPRNYTSYAKFRTACARLLPTLFAQHVTRDTALHIFTEDKKETLDSLLQGKQKQVWKKALCNELGRLAQGMNGRVRQTNTINFIPRSEVPSHKKVTYANMVCDYRPSNLNHIMSVSLPVVTDYHMQGM